MRINISILVSSLFMAKSCQMQASVRKGPEMEKSGTRLPSLSLQAAGADAAPLPALCLSAALLQSSGHTAFSFSTHIAVQLSMTSGPSLGTQQVKSPSLTVNSKLSKAGSCAQL